MHAGGSVSAHRRVTVVCIVEERRESEWRAAATMLTLQRALCCMFQSGEARPQKGLLPKFNISLLLGMVLICEPTLIFYFGTIILCMPSLSCH